jgi:hypothetical protein
MLHFQIVCVNWKCIGVRGLSSLIFSGYWRKIVFRDTSVVIATRYGVDRLGIESQLGRDFPHSARQALGPTQPPTQWVPCFPGCTASRAWRWPSTPSNAEVKERVELYLYNISGPS